MQPGAQSPSSQSGQLDRGRASGELPQPQESGGDRRTKSAKSDPPLGGDNMRHMPDMSIVQTGSGQPRQSSPLQPGSAAVTSGGISNFDSSGQFEGHQQTSSARGAMD